MNPTQDQHPPIMKTIAAHLDVPTFIETLEERIAPATLVYGRGHRDDHIEQGHRRPA